MFMRLFLFAIILFIISACGVKQPVETDTGAETGDIFVDSTPQSASIYLDNNNTGKTTPDTLYDIPTGVHSIKVFKDGYESTLDSFIVDVRPDALHQVSFVLNALQQFGFLFVTTQPSGADIFINNQPTGKVTPDTVKLLPGTHILKIIKNGFVSHARQIEVIRDSLQNPDHKFSVHQRVLLEAFGNVSCEPCVESAENLEAFVQNIPADQFAILEYYAYWPSPNDPFYLEAPDDNRQRIQYYSAAPLPVLRIDGTHNVDPKNAQEIQDIFDQARQAAQDSVAISINKTLTGTILNVTVEVYNLDTRNDLSDLRLFAAVTEDDIHFDEPPGSNGLTDFNFVFRGFLSDREGDPLEQASTPVLIEYEKAWPNTWIYANSKLIVFIQNIETKAIIQTSLN